MHFNDVKDVKCDAALTLIGYEPFLDDAWPDGRQIYSSTNGRVMVWE
jgi:hypothetical protein